MREYETKILEFKQSITTRDTYSFDLLDIVNYLYQTGKVG